MNLPFENTYARLPSEFFEKVSPTPVAKPKLLFLNDRLALKLGLDPNELRTEKGLEVLSGNRVPEGAEPLSMAYSGHQFGGFSPLLGDGRAILLGEINGLDVQLKGAGRTPFSRRGDGRSALGPVLREYLVSESMAVLGIPTTRALAAVETGEMVLREEAEKGAIFTRVASSHLRVGTAQFFAARQDLDNLRVLVDYANRRHFPGAHSALDLLPNVIRAQAHLIARWMSVGFIHGVMNTDNTSLSGETIDYGPCAFMDLFDPAQKFSYIDQMGRYAYQNQPGIAQWNLTRLAEALLPLIDDNDEKAVEFAKAELEKFPRLFEAERLRIFSGKIGLPNNDDWELIQELLDLFASQKIDFTNGFRDLADEDKFLAHFSDQAPAETWLTERRKRGEINSRVMDSTNPAFIPRNHQVEKVLAAANEGDTEPFRRLFEVLQTPYQTQSGFDEYRNPPAPEEIVTATFCGT